MFRITSLVEEAVNLLRGIDTKLELVIRLSHLQGKQVMSAIDDLIEQVSKNTDVELSAVQAINGLIAEVTAHAQANNDDKLKALTAKLAASAGALASAVAAGTPAAPTAPAPAPEPAPAPQDPAPAPPPTVPSTGA